MMQDTTGNTFSRFLRRVASFWDNASKYHVFLMLASIALLVMVLVFVPEVSGSANAVFNIIIFCGVAIVGYVIFRMKRMHLAAFAFVAALVLRLILVFVMEAAPTDVFMCNDARVRTYKWIRYYDSVLLQADEFFYAYHIQTYKNLTTREFLKLPELVKNSHRTSFLMSRIFRFFGDEFVWLRLFETFLGAFAAAFITMAAQELYNRNTALLISMLGVIAPQTTFYSVRFLKEIWLIFASSLMVYSFAIIIKNKRYVSAILPIVLAGMIFIWLRLEYGLMLIAAIAMAIYFRRNSSSIGKMAVVVFTILMIAMIGVGQIGRLTQKTENLFNKYEQTERGEKGRAESVPLLNKAYTSKGPFRLINIPLSILNPPPRKLYHVIAPANNLHDFVLQADIWQWWLLLPFLGIGAVVTVVKRVEFLTFLLPYVVIVSISALLLGGLLPSVYRYRDALAPVAFIIIGVGFESYISQQSHWKNYIIISAYSLFVVLAVFLYMKGF